MNGSETAREYQRQYRKKNRDKVNAWQREWRKKNPNKTREYRERYWDKKAKESPIDLGDG